MAGENYDEGLSGRPMIPFASKAPQICGCSGRATHECRAALVLTWRISVRRRDRRVLNSRHYCPDRDRLPREKAGLRVNDSVIALNDKKISTWDDLKGGIGLA